MDVDRFGITAIADQPDDPLGLAERISADEMATLGELLERGEQFFDLGLRIRMVEDRQAEGRLGDEDIAGDRHEGRAGGIGAALVIAGNDDAQPILFDGDLGRTEHMAGRVKAHPHAIDIDLFPEGCGLLFSAKILAITQPHDVQGLACCQHLGMARAGMVRMAVGDQRPLDGTDRIDMEAADGAEQPGRGGMKQRLGFHALEDRA